MPVQLFSDEDVTRLISPTEAVQVMESVFLARSKKNYAGAPRWQASFGKNQRIVFTVGAVDSFVGFRTYLRSRLPHDDQLTAVWDSDTGELLAVVVGAVLGAMRTGAIGAVAIKHMANPEARILGLIGSGRQAFTQLNATAAVQKLDEVRVYSRSEENRQTFCEDVKILMPHINIHPVDSAEQAVRGAQIVIGASNSPQPVIKGDWLEQGVHVSTIGPKGKTQRETDEKVVERAGWIATDSPEQAKSYDDGLILDDTAATLHDLADVVSGKIKRPNPDAISLFISTGLAGTEVALAARLLAKANTTEDVKILDNQDFEADAS